MSVGLGRLPVLNPVGGIRLAVAGAGICYQGRNDVVLIECSEGSVCAGVFTQNAFCAAPVVLAKQNMSNARARVLLVNSGNANAGTGQAGMDAAISCCESVAEAAGCKPEQVLPFSTGVIGELLPADKIRAVIPQAVSRLDENNWGVAARAIMTTDTLPKGVSTRLQMDGREVTITGIAKGSGMIRPDMATMLAFVATDAGFDRSLLQGCLSSAVDQSFNRITVDGDTSTNDACMLMATGQSGVQISANSRGYDDFIEALNSVCRQLAHAIIRDGEGVTKFISVCVEQGVDTQECLDVAYTVAHSPLVKTAFFASDPNWGRILAAVGRAGVNGLVIENVSLYLNGVCIVEQGARSASYTEEQGQAVMNEEEILVRICLGRGCASETVWTTDLSHEYVTINTEYRT